MDERILVKPEEAGRLLGVGRSKAYELIRRRELPAIRLGGSVRVPVAALRRGVEEQLESQASGR